VRRARGRSRAPVFPTRLGAERRSQRRALDRTGRGAARRHRRLGQPAQLHARDVDHVAGAQVLAEQRLAVDLDRATRPHRLDAHDGRGAHEAEVPAGDARPVDPDVRALVAADDERALVHRRQQSFAVWSPDLELVRHVAARA
jgi:hypothetical protein